MTKANDFLTGFFKCFLNIIYPAWCEICGVGLGAFNDDFICKSCASKIVWLNKSRCLRCGRGLPYEPDDKNSCGWCSKEKYFFSQSHAAAVYEGVIKEYLHAFKYQKKIYLKGFLGRILAEQVHDSGIIRDVDVIMPVPLDRIRFFDRQFNQSAILSGAIGRRFGIPVIGRNLIRKYHRAPQASLGREDRIKNIKGAFYVKYPQKLKDKRVLLVDDIMTTASTVNECARELIGAGAKDVRVLVVARGR